MIKLGMLENNWVNPVANAPTTEVSKLNDTNSAGIAGIIGSPAPKPNKVKITPKIAVITKPRNTAAGTFLMYKIIIFY